ncbi:hypothetical protein [Nocardioides pocheonensis]|uniref:Uncharacterized protein n=1 Tax=Nocardioides pocheonensis TaxID=661485 RepID=A0A3N0GID9_9ACTN|nr:hypothetical protein [Nocardioides pocheonensis]RNM12201.1 hypothetical protein EFL26_20585 [Nocardioides pocheonensis]
MDNDTSSTTISASLRLILVDLARREEELADNEAARTPYWATCPPSVIGHRTAAAALRAEADYLGLVG